MIMNSGQMGAPRPPVMGAPAPTGAPGLMPARPPSIAAPNLMSAPGAVGSFSMPPPPPGSMGMMPTAGTNLPPIQPQNPNVAPPGAMPQGPNPMGRQFMLASALRRGPIP